VSDARLVMLVEDDHDVREAIAEALGDAGFTVIEAENGADALTRLRVAERLPRVILLDLMMPVMDGRQFREVQRGDPRLAGIPIIVLSAHGNARDRASEMGIAEFLPKPIRLDVLLQAVRRYR
jgi:CheY-like chemotaxis protein